MNNDTIALGVTVFKRTAKLANLLQSIPEPIDVVYIADDGHTDERTHLYDQEYQFELQLLDLEYDAGVGYGRTRIVDALDEEYLLMVDSDYRIPLNIDLLRKQLGARPEFGAISGLIIEHGRVQGLCHDLFEEQNILVRDTPERETQNVAGYPLVEFDFIPSAAMFRRSCLEEQSWDPEYVTGMDHLDFYVAHHRNTDWRFGVSPTVLFPHEPGGGAEYEGNRTDPEKIFRSKRYFLQKWGYDQVVGRNYWFDNEKLDKPLSSLEYSPTVPVNVGAIIMSARDMQLKLQSLLR